MDTPSPKSGLRQSFLATDSDRGKRLDAFLAARLPDLSRSRIQQLLREGLAGIEESARLRSRLRKSEPEGSLKAGYRLRGGEVFWVEITPPPPLRAYAEAIPLSILYEDDDIVALDKPAGMVVHIGAGVSSGTVVNALLHHFSTLSQVGGELRPGIVHRLDKNTSGILLVAKNDVAHRKLASQFAGRTIEKRYIALVHGSVKKEEGSISAAIGRDPVRRVRMTARVATGRAALSRYCVLRRFRGFTLVEVQILTGRTHQVRVHMTSIGHPVVGDTLYGAPAKLPVELFTMNSDEEREGNPRGKYVPTLNRNFLHAAIVRFQHPRTGDGVEIRSALPEDLEMFLSHLIAVN